MANRELVALDESTPQLGAPTALDTATIAGDFAVAGATTLASLELIDPLDVEEGGTGQATLLEGGLLLGSGTGKISSLPVMADGQMVVGDGAGDPVLESGATLRTSIGVGTGDNVAFADITATGIITAPSQPAFLAYNSVTDSNVTGSATTVTVDFDTEVFDQGSDFTADTFTAPVDGRYLLQANVRVGGITAAATNGQLLLTTSNRAYLSITGAALSSIETFKITVVADMDANDTAFIRLDGNGEASDVWDIFGTASPQTFFSGCLLA